MSGRPPRVGFVGAGSVLWAYLQLLDRMVPRGHALEGPVCARRRETWEALRARRPGIELVATPEEVVAAEVDVVAILTAADSHAALARLALEHGRHVLVEKPLAESAGEARELYALARERGVHLVAAPFVYLAPTFRALWTQVRDGAIGHVHSARASYGTALPDWNAWMRSAPGGPLADCGVYNLKGLTALLGPAVEVVATGATFPPEAGGDPRSGQPDAVQVTMRHASGALSSVVTAWEVQAYRRPAIELHGTEGTANLLGDDWDPRGHELWTAGTGCWRHWDALDSTWLWTDGLRELVAAVRETRAPLHDADHDLHVLELLAAASEAMRTRAAVPLRSTFAPLEALRLELPAGASHLHDHTRPPEDQR